MASFSDDHTRLISSLGRTDHAITDWIGTVFSIICGVCANEYETPLYKGHAAQTPCTTQARSSSADLAAYLLKSVDHSAAALQLFSELPATVLP